MKKILVHIFICIPVFVLAQTENNNTTGQLKFIKPYNKVFRYKQPVPFTFKKNYVTPEPKFLKIMLNYIIIISPLK
jgi:hypothetical protein